MKEYKIYIGGEFIETSTELMVSNLFSGKNFAKTWLAGNTELEKAIEIGKKAQKDLRSLPVY